MLNTGSEVGSSNKGERKGIQKILDIWSALGDTYYPICYWIMIVIKVRHEENQAFLFFSTGVVLGAREDWDEEKTFQVSFGEWMELEKVTGGGWQVGRYSVEEKVTKDGSWQGEGSYVATVGRSDIWRAGKEEGNGRKWRWITLQGSDMTRSSLAALFIHINRILFFFFLILKKNCNQGFGS